jgi:hypothetical protein
MRLNGGPVHHRTFDYNMGGSLTIVDRVKANTHVTCRNMIHLHPECFCNFTDERTVSIKYPCGRFQIAFIGDGQLEHQEGWYSPEFYLKQKISILIFSWISSKSTEVSYKIEHLS